MSIADVMRAADQAARWHAKQRRKGPDKAPYINHLLEVAALVAAVEADADVVIAALLHDAIEDQKIPAEEIADAFGNAVTSVVLEVTDDKSLDKEVRKRLQIENAPKKSRPAKIVALADKCSNMWSVAKNPPADWSFEQRKKYVDWSREVAEAGLLGQSEALDAKFWEAHRAAEQALRSTAVA